MSAAAGRAYILTTEDGAGGDAFGLLMDAGYSVMERAFGEDCAGIIERTLPSLICLAVDPAGAEGLGVIRAVAAVANCPVVVLAPTSHKGFADALDAGADLCLPVHASDVVASQTRALVRRATAEARRLEQAITAPRRLGNVSYTPAGRKVTVNGAYLPLTPMEFRVFTYFMEHPHTVITATEVISAATGARVEPNAAIESLKVYVKRLRQKLADAGANLALANVRGLGYILEPMAPPSLG